MREAPMVRVRLNSSEITSWDSFHDQFARAFGFFDGYGRNMNAWIDCMSDLDDPSSGMLAVHGDRDNPVLMEITHAEEFTQRCPDLLAELVVCSALVNRRFVDHGGAPILALVFIA